MFAVKINRRQRTSQTDALGRTTAVWEDSTAGGLNYETDYGYDLLNNLTSVNQKGDNSAPRTRSFVYDSLSRLTSATNPESGTITYTYSNTSAGCASAPGIVCTKTAPKPNQTLSATVVTTYSYDALNRLTQKSYNDGSTATAKFGYDGTALSGCTTAPPALTDTYPVSQRTAMCDGSGGTSWKHDQMGRVLTEQRIINGTSAINKALQYSYYKDGSLDVLTFPSGRKITYTPDSSGNYSAGRMASAVDVANGVNYVTGAIYAPQGALASVTIGGVINGAFSYNSRLQPVQMFYGTNAPQGISGTSCPATVGNIMHRAYDFHSGSGDNGNVFIIRNCGDTTRTQNFDYDSLNRIKDAYTQGSKWGEAFTIDPWGNLTNIGPYLSKPNHETLNAAPATNNQLTGFGYDAAGNMTSNGTATYTYDAENRLTATAGYTYAYDADGNRVKKCSNANCTTGTLYWRGTGSDPLLPSSPA